MLAGTGALDVTLKLARVANPTPTSARIATGSSSLQQVKYKLSTHTPYSFSLWRDDKQLSRTEMMITDPKS